MRILREYEIADKKPRVACSECKQINCLDYSETRRGKQPLPICEDCDKNQERLKNMEQKKLATRQRIKDSGLPEKWHNCLWDSFRELTPTDIEIKKLAQESWHRDKGLTLIGPPGVGKTHILACIALAFIRKGISVKFIKARDLISSITESWKSKTPYNPIELVMGYSVIILEDLTFEAPPPEFILRNFNQLMDKIYESGNTKLFISTNLPLSGPKSLESYLGAHGEKSPFVSRLCELTLIKKWPDNFPDRRREKK